MKTLLYLPLSAMISLGIMSCQKMDDSQFTQSDPKSSSDKSKNMVHAEMYMYDDTITNYLTTRDYKLYSWSRTGSSSDFVDHNLLFDYKEFGTIECSNVSNGNIELTFQNNKIILKDPFVSNNGTQILFTATDALGVRELEFSLKDGNADFSDFPFIPEGEVFPKMEGIWPLIYGAALLAAGAVSIYCGNQISAAAANCAANCMGFEAGSCGGECIEVCVP